MAEEYKALFDFYTLVRNKREGYQFIQEDQFRTIDVYSTVEEAFAALEESQEVYDLEVARVQILRPVKKEG
jgi:hypothetical protein